MPSGKTTTLIMSIIVGIRDSAWALIGEPLDSIEFLLASSESES